jgi:hypothetical protein
MESKPISGLVYDNRCADPGRVLPSGFENYPFYFWEVNE